MNTYRTATLLACFLAPGLGLGHGDPIVDLCRKKIADANLEEALGKLARDKIVIDLCDNQLENIDRDVFRRFYQLEGMLLNDNPDLGFPTDGSPFLVIKSLTELQCVNCGVEKILKGSLQGLPKLVRIILNHNRITDIEKLAFRENSELRLIDLRHNLLERLPNELVEGLINFEQLDLSFNRKLNVDGDQPFLYSSTLKELKFPTPPAEPMVISDCYISSYLTIITLALIGALVILVGVWLKKKKYDSELKLNSLARTALNQVQSTYL
ncbi:hypothetical protein quinque_005112 [Culex quinquefasciatus]